MRHVLSVFWDALPRHVVIHFDAKKGDYFVDPKADRFPTVALLIRHYHVRSTPLARLTID